MIAVGQIQPGDMLPTQKELMDRFGVAMGTVQQALGRMQTRGIVASTRGKGTVVCDTDMLSDAGILRPRVEMLQLDYSNKNDTLVSDTTAMIQQTLSASGFEMNVRTQLPESSAELNLWAQKIRAAVVTGYHLPARVLQALRAADRPVIIAGELHDQPRPTGVSQVTVEVENIMQLALASLTSMGHRRIALGRGPDTTYNEGLQAAFESTAAKMGLSEDVAVWMIPPGTDGSDVADRWHAMSPLDRPTAIIVDGGQRACRVIYALQRQNIHVPKHLSVFGISGQVVSQLAIPTLSRVETTASRLGKRLAEVLLEVLQQRIVIRESIAPRLVHGDTCLSIDSNMNESGRSLKPSAQLSPSA